MRFGRWRVGRWIFTAAAAAIVGCATTPPAEVEDRSFQSDAPTQPAASAPSAAVNDNAHYRVQRGDTLYSIAFRRGLDYRDLASWNGIEAPYRIFVGQDLRMNPGGAAAAPISPSNDIVPPSEGVITRAAPDEVKAAKVTALAAPVSPPLNTTPAAPAKPAVVEQPISKPVSPPPAAPVVPAKPPEPIVTPPEPTKPAPPVALSSGTWRWPSSGAIVGNFVSGDQTRQGIDIAGKAGDPVLASADGDVVYSGNGLLGYGELIIIKHNANFLSAYGHNRKRLVQEGEKVRAGQQIAEMGSSASSRDELHFEIRKNGKPVNPLDYLPNR